MGCPVSRRTKTSFTAEKPAPPPPPPAGGPWRTVLLLALLGGGSFAAAYAWPGLRRLGLRGNQIPSSSIPTFAANPHLASLAEIDFRTNPIRSKDLTPLREACPDTRFLTDDTDRSNTWALAPEDRP